MVWVPSIAFHRLPRDRLLLTVDISEPVALLFLLTEMPYETANTSDFSSVVR